jgi:hypothetical protein
MTLQIPDETIEGALKALNSSTHARAKAAAEFSEKQLKTVLARLSLCSDAKTVSDREASAYTHPDYQKALEDHRSVSEAYYAARDRRDAASALIECWRSLKADGRRADRIG